jgi:hypothetical protein
MSQLSAVGGGSVRRKKRNPYLDEIRGQYGKATSDVIHQKQQALQSTQRAEDVALQERSLALTQEANRQQARASQVGTGLTALTLATNTASNPIFKGGKAGKGGASGGSNGISTGSRYMNTAVPAALAGYSVYNLIDTKDDDKRLAAGIGAGLVTDYAMGGATRDVVNKGAQWLSSIWP